MSGSLNYVQDLSSQRRVKLQFMTQRYYLLNGDSTEVIVMLRDETNSLWVGANDRKVYSNFVQ